MMAVGGNEILYKEVILGVVCECNVCGKDCFYSISITHKLQYFSYFEVNVFHYYLPEICIIYNGFVIKLFNKVFQSVINI